MSILDQPETLDSETISTLVPVEPLANNPIRLLRLVPEKTVAAAFDHFELRAFDIVPQMRGNHRRCAIRSI